MTAARCIPFLIAGAVALSRGAHAEVALSAVSNPAPTDAAWVVTGEGLTAHTGFFVWTPSLHVGADGEPITTEAWTAHLKDPVRLPASPTREGLVALRVLACESQVAALEMPDVLPGLGQRRFRGKFTGLLYARSGGTWSRPLVVNRPEIYFVRPGRATPGSPLRIIGRNFRSHWYNGHGFAVLRHCESGRIVVPTRVCRYAHGGEGGLEDVQRFVELPSDLAPGPYEVLVCNRSGGRLGWSEPVPLQVVAPEPPPEQHLIRLAAEGAKGDGMHNDSPAMLAALKEAELLAERGTQHRAVILIPPGRFRLSEPMHIRFPVTIRGCGMDNTTLVRLHKPGQARHRQARFQTGSDVTIEDLSIEGIPIDMRYAKKTGLVEDCAVRRVRINAPVGGQWVRRLAITGCRLVAPAGRTWFKNIDRSDLSYNVSLFPQWHSGSGGLEYRQACQRSILEFNHKRGPRGFIFHKWGEPGHYRNLVYANTVNDTQTWDGEGMLAEGAAKVYGARVAEATRNSVTLDGGTFKDGQLGGKVVVITRGRGLGQYRFTSGSRGRRIALASPWHVVPAKGSLVTAMGGTVENIIARNSVYQSYGGGPLLYHCGGLGNRMIANRVWKGSWVYLWSTRLRKADVRHKDVWTTVPDYWNTFAHNQLDDQATFFFTFGMGGVVRQTVRRLEAVHQLGNAFRDNSILRPFNLRPSHLDAPGAISYSSSTYRRFLKEPITGKDPSEAAYWFNVVERNRIVGSPVGVYVSERSFRGVVRHNTFEHVAEPVRDRGMRTVVVE